MIFAKGNYLTFPDTPRGRERASEVVGAFQGLVELDAKHPQTVLLLADFELRPVDQTRPPAKKLPNFRETMGRIGQLCVLLFFILGGSTMAAGLGETPGLAPFYGGGAASATPILADAIPQITEASSAWMNQLLVWTGILFFLIGGIAQGKALFARKPAITEELQNLERKIEVAQKTMESKIDESDRRRSVGIAGAHKEADRHATELRAEINDVKEKLSIIDKTQSALDERTKTTNHTVDSISLKVDRLLQAGGKRIP